MYKPASPSVDYTADRKFAFNVIQSESNVATGHVISGDSTSPISVILVSSGSRGNKLLFRYPFQRVSENTSSLASKCVSYHFLEYSHRYFGLRLADVVGHSNMCSKV